VTKVGSILLRFSGLAFGAASLVSASDVLFLFAPSSVISESLSSLLIDSASVSGRKKPIPLTLLLALCVLPLVPPATAFGVSGGVHRGTIPGTGPECAAATLGTLPSDGVWCINTAAGDGAFAPLTGVVAAAVGGGGGGLAGVLVLLSEFEFGTANEPIEDVLMLRAGLAGRALAKAAEIDV
jgi:hypothetical protein